jgi:hypothetical protein
VKITPSALGPAFARLFGRARDAVERFAFAPASAAPLAVLRIGLGAVLLAQAVLIAPAYLDLYGPDGILQGPIRDGLADHTLPGLGWLVRACAHLGAAERPVIAGAGLAYLTALVALIVGHGTRAAAVTTWLLHFMLMTTAYNTTYGVDVFAHIFLFYLIWMPSGAALSLDSRLRRSPAAPSPTARLALRVAQIHLCIVYFMAGLEKALGHPWWNGEAMWRSLMLPEYDQLDFSWLSRHAWVARVGGWMVLLVETGFPIFIWSRLTRRPWIVAMVAMHLAIAVFMGLQTFGVIMVVLVIAAFGVPAEPAPAPSEPQGEPGSGPRPRDPASAVARRWAALLLALLGGVALSTELLALLHAAPAAHDTVPIEDLGLVRESPPESP